MTNSLGLILPTLWRSKRLRSVLENIESTLRYNDHRIYLVLEDNDEASIIEAHMLSAAFPLTVVLSPHRNPNAAVNLGFTHTSEDFICNATDDLEFTPGWYESVLRCFKDNPHAQVVAAWDGLFDRGKSLYIARRHYIVTQGTIDSPGKVFHPGYRHVYADTEFLDTAICRDVFKYCREALVKHCNINSPYAKHPADATSQHLGELNTSNHDGELYESRKRLFQGKGRIDVPFD